MTLLGALGIAAGLGAGLILTGMIWHDVYRLRQQAVEDRRLAANILANQRMPL